MQPSRVRFDGVRDVARSAPPTPRWAPYLIITTYFAVVFAAFGVHGGDLETCGGPDGYGKRGPAGCPWFAGPLHSDPLHAAEVRYRSWSSRFTVELIEYGLSHTLWLFVLMTIALSWLFLWSAKQLLDIGTVHGLAAFAVLYCLVVPFTLHTSAGTYSTLIFYSWTLFLGSFSLAVLVRDHRGPGNPAAVRLAAVLALTVALCSEQFLVFFAVVVGYLLIAQRRQHRLSLLTILYACAGMGAALNVVLCPGNTARKQIEIDYWMPSFRDQSLADKLANGFTHMTSTFLDAGQSSAVAVAVMSAVAIWGRLRANDSWPLVPAAAAPFVLMALMVNGATGFISFTGNIVADLLASLALFVPLGLIGARALQHDTRGWHVVGVALAGGVASAMLMSFSPTVWGSADRTLYILLVCVAATLFVILRSARASVLDPR